jgi:hypothetical protein
VRVQPVVQGRQPAPDDVGNAAHARRLRRRPGRFREELGLSCRRRHSAILRRPAGKRRAACGGLSRCL